MAGEQVEDPGFPSPFAEDEPTTDPQGAEAQDSGEESPDEWEPPSREAWEATQRDIQASQERERQAAQRADQNQQLLAQLLQGSGPGQSVPPSASQPGSEPADLSDMPDPVTDRENYARWLSRHLSTVEQRATQRVQQATQQMSDAQRADRLFDSFASLHPAVRDKRPVVEAAAVAAQLTGQEPESVIFQRTEEVLRQWGIPLAEKQEIPKPTSTGVGPGSGEGGGRRRRAAAEPPSKDLVDELAENQVKLGIM